MDLTELGFAVLKHRRGRRWTQQELATRAGISKTSVRRLERADCRPDTHTLIAVADALGLQLSDLLATGEGEAQAS